MPAFARSIDDDAADEPLLFVRELTHRVANQYTQAIATLALAAAGVADAEAQQALTEAQRRLRAQARAHQALQPPLERGLIDLGEHLAQLCTTLSRAALDERGIRLTLRHEDISLEAGRCWRVGLIAAELITNAVRHSNTARITIDVAIDGASIVCKVSNDGACERFIAGRGSQVVDGLARDLGGGVERSFGPEGVSVLVAFPGTAPSRADQPGGFP